MSLSSQSTRWTGISLILGFLTLVGLTVFTPQKVIEFTAMLLAVIAAIYIGFILPDGQKSVKRVEVATAVLFIIVALAGLWLNPWFLVLGYIGHGMCDRLVSAALCRI